MTNTPSGKTILVTGANGFIGFYVTKFLYDTKEFDITALVHKNISDELKSLKINIIKHDIIKENNDIGTYDIVIHCMGLAKDIGDENNFKKLNYTSVKAASKLAKKKFIHISSTDVYGIKDFVNADETTPFCNFPKNPYPKYKIQAENWLKENYKKPYVIIRPAAVWGENDKTIEKRAANFLKVSPYIVHFGRHKGQNRWPMANISNVAKTVSACIKSDKFNNQAINVIDTKITTIDEYYRFIGKKYFPDKKYKTLYLPLFIGKIIGFVSTTLSNLLKLKEPVFDPTYYSLHHVVSNLDFNNEKMLLAIKTLDGK